MFRTESSFVSCKRQLAEPERLHQITIGIARRGSRPARPRLTYVALCEEGRAGLHPQGLLSSNRDYAVSGSNDRLTVRVVRRRRFSVAR
jgi:hypothetical protein